MSFISVQPVISSIVKVNIRIYNVDLYNSLSALITQYNQDGQLVKSVDITISTTEYNQWSSDDQLVDLLLSKCDLRRQDSPTGETGPTGEDQ